MPTFTVVNALCGSAFSLEVGINPEVGMMDGADPARIPV
jgi:hypothetical protein